MGTGKKRVVVIGCGMVADTYMACFADLSDALELVGVVASTPQSAARFLARHAETAPNARSFADVREAIGDSPDFAIVLTPPDTRHDIVTTLAKAGIPILMEKPVERSLNAARTIVETCEQADVPLGIMLQHRARPSAMALQSLMETTRLGALGLVEIYVPWWRPQSYYDAPGRGELARDGGGVLLTQAVHTLDLALQFTGPVEAVKAMVCTSDFHDMETEDFVSAGLRFQSGIHGTLMASTALYPGRGEEIILHFAQATVTLAGAMLTIAWRDGREEIIGAQAATGAGADPMAFSHGWHQAVIEDFMASLDASSPPIASGRSALPVHELIEAIIANGAEDGWTQIGGET